MSEKNGKTQTAKPAAKKTGIVSNLELNKKVTGMETNIDTLTEAHSELVDRVENIDRAIGSIARSTGDRLKTIEASLEQITGNNADADKAVQRIADSLKPKTYVPFWGNVESQNKWLRRLEKTNEVLRDAIAWGGAIVVVATATTKAVDTVKARKAAKLAASFTEDK